MATGAANVVDMVGPHEFSAAGPVETKANPPCLAAWRRRVEWLEQQIAEVDMEISDAKRKNAPGPLAKALQDSMVAFYAAERAELEAMKAAYQKRIGTLRGDLLDVDRLLSALPTKKENGGK